LLVRYFELKKISKKFLGSYFEPFIDINLRIFDVLLLVIYLNVTRLTNVLRTMNILFSKDFALHINKKHLEKQIQSLKPGARFQLKDFAIDKVFKFS